MAVNVIGGISALADAGHRLASAEWAIPRLEADLEDAAARASMLADELTQARAERDRAHAELLDLARDAS